MRKLMALAIVFFTAVPSSFALFGLGDISYDGSLEVSGNAANNEVDFGNDPDSTASVTDGTGTGNDHRGRTATRLRLGMSAQITEGVNGRVEVIRGPRQYGTGATTVAGEEALIAFHNAYVELEDLWGFKARLGRQYVGNPGDLVWNISPTDDDNLTANSIDGLLLQCRKYDFLHTDIFTGKAAEDDTLNGTFTDTDQDDGAAAGDVNLSAIDFVLPTLIPGGRLNVGYLLGDDDNSQLSTDDNSLRIARVGINGGIRENWLTYRAEYFQNMGQFNGAGKLPAVGAREDLDYEGSAIDLGVGLNLPETSVGTFSVWLNWLAASGDDDTTDSKDDSFHDFTPLGFNTSDRLLGEIFGKSNVLGGGTPLGQGLNSADATGTAFSGATQGQGLEVINVGVQYKPTFLAKTMVRLDYYMFSRGEDSVTTVAGAPAVKVGDDLGTEIDLTFGYDHSESVNVEFGYAMLSPDDGLTGLAVPGQPSPQDENVTKLFARAKIKWGGAAQ